MPRLRFEITPASGGWSVMCNGVGGPPFTTRNAAVLDTLAIIERLRAQGDQADLRVFDLDGVGRVVEPKDAKLFR